MNLLLGFSKELLWTTIEICSLIQRNWVLRPKMKLNYLLLHRYCQILCRTKSGKNIKKAHMHTHLGWKVVQCATHGPPAVKCVHWPSKICNLKLTLRKGTRHIRRQVQNTSWLIKNGAGLWNFTCAPTNRFSGLISLCITCFPWQYTRARANDATYCPSYHEHTITCSWFLVNQ